jgi:hypothetical protein
MANGVRRAAIKGYFTRARIMTLLYAAIAVFVFLALARFSRLRGTKSLFSLGRLVGGRRMSPSRAQRRAEQLAREEEL